MFYLFIENGKINGCGECPTLNEEILNVEVSDEVFFEYIEAPNKFAWDGERVVENPDYEAELAQAERERIGRLCLTGADVERGIYQAKGMDFEDVVALVEGLITDGHPTLALPVQGGDAVALDIKALKIELKANHFYRGNPYVNAVGALLGFTSEQLDKFFEFNDWTYLNTNVDATI